MQRFNIPEYEPYPVKHLVWLRYAAITAVKCFLQLLISSGHQLEGIWAHSFVTNSFKSAMLVSSHELLNFWSYHNISTELRSGHWVSHSKTLTLSCFKLYVVDWLECPRLRFDASQTFWLYLAHNRSLHFPLESCLYSVAGVGSIHAVNTVASLVSTYKYLCTHKSS